MGEATAASEVCLPVEEVTLMEDRARVKRVGRVALPAGATRLWVSGVAPVLSDKTLAGRLEGGHVRDVRVVRRAIVRAEDRAAPVAEIDAEIERTERAVQREDRQRARATAALGLLSAAGDETLADLVTDAAWSDADEGEWSRRLDALSERERALRDEQLAAAATLDEARRSLAHLRARRAALSSPATETVATVELDVELDEAGECELSLEYVVPNACWRPQHRALLVDGVVVVESEACVWQRTGEDWPDVTVRLSTQRPSLGAEPPALQTDRLRAQRRREVVEVEQRQQTVETAGLGRGQAAAELPGIDDGGEVLELRATHRASVPGDGRPQRLPLSSFETPTTARRLCTPELTAAVLLVTAQDNAGPWPLLAGPVDLVQHGGFVGRTSILYVAPGERFELAWGPDAGLRVHRVVEDLEPETSGWGSWQSTEKRVVDRLSNLGPDARTVELVERVPVSEIEKVKIEPHPDRTTGRLVPDEDGFVRWQVDLPGFARERIELRYTLRRHSDVVGL